MKKFQLSTLIQCLIVFVAAGIITISCVSCKEKINLKENGLREFTLSEEEFFAIPGPDKIWVYYWWLKGNVTRESITHDLEEMKRKGIGGFLLFDSRGYWDDYHTGIIPVPLEIRMEFMSPEWREMVKHTMHESARLGLEMSINLANTGGSLRGPWDLGKDGPKKLIWTSATIEGPAFISADLKDPEGKKYFQDVALMAVRINPTMRSTADKTEVDLNGHWNDIMIPAEDAITAGEVTDLDEKLNDGRLKWDAPEGQWMIVRFGTHVIADAGSVDILNKEAVNRYFNLMGSEILNDAGSLAGTTLKYLYNVSWEGGEPNWTTGFKDDFIRFRGYKIDDYMPALAGLIIENREVSKRFMRDYFRTISDCFMNNCYKNIGELSNIRGVKWHSENGGPWQREAAMFREADMLSFWGTNDIPQGEYWCDNMNALSGKTNSRYTSMASHIYGQPVSAVEAFTHMTVHWSKYPEYLKTFADVNFIDGSNMFIWHTFTASPPEIGKPGYEYFAGTHLNPRVTWWNMAGDFITYMGRCQYMLRKGKYVADVCCYVSDKNYVRWGRGEKWNEGSSLELGPGYKYDLIDTEVLVNRLSVKDGKLVLPDGMSYKVMVVDLEDQTIPLNAMAKIIELVRSGAAIVLGQNKPVRTPGLTDYPVCDDEIIKLADELWGQDVSGEPRERKFGRGSIITGTLLDEVLKRKNILPDFEGPFEYIHREGNNAEIYFIRGSGKAECRFRIYGKKPELWDPVNGTISKAVSYSFSDDGRTIIPIELPVNGSLFLVFSDKKENKHITSVSGTEGGLKVTERRSDTLRLVQWKSGNYVLTSSVKKSFEITGEVEPPVSLSGPWEVCFTPGWGAPEKTTFENLTEWNNHPDERIKYFSGSGTYKISFNLTSGHTGIPCRLRLGKVNDIARVNVNGKDLGIVWTEPWTIDIKDAIKAGQNELEIEVANCWVNRLIGDAGLPEGKRYTRTNVRLLPEKGKYRNYEAISAKDPLLPSGLSGPVIVEFGKDHQIVF